MTRNLIISCCALLALSALAEPETNLVPATVRLTLDDGSVLRAEPQTRALKATSPYVGEFSADFTKIAELNIATGSVATIFFRNKDLVTAKILEETLPVKSGLGMLSVPWNKVKRATFSAAAKEASSHLIFSCTFDSEEEVRHPTVGPEGRIINVSLTNGKNGQAMCVPDGRPTVTYNFPAGFFKDKGRVEFWAKILSNSGRYRISDPRFFWLRFDNNEELQIEFTANNGLGNGGLYGRISQLFRTTGRGFSAGDDYARVLGLGQEHDWHHCAFVWNVNGVIGYKDASGNTSTAVMLVDGKVVQDQNFNPEGDSIAGVIESIALPSVLSFPSSPERYRGGQVRAPYMIDDLRIFDIDSME